MRKAIYVALVALMLAGCSHNDGFGMQYDANPDIVEAQELFGQLMIVNPGAVGPASVRTEVTVDSDQFIHASLKFYEDFELAHECNGMELLDDETFGGIQSYVYDADLIDYDKVDPQICPGSLPYVITYTLSDGRVKEFEFTSCVPLEDEADELIHDMIEYVMTVAEQDIEECNSSSYAFEDADAQPAEEEAGEGEAAEE